MHLCNLTLHMFMIHSGVVRFSGNDFISGTMCTVHEVKGAQLDANKYMYLSVVPDGL